MLGYSFNFGAACPRGKSVAGGRTHTLYAPKGSPAPGSGCYWHVMSVPADGGKARQITDGPFHAVDGNHQALNDIQ